ALLRRAGGRVVETWVLPEAPIDSAVGFDNRAAGAVVARRFAALGRRRPAYLGGEDVRGMLRLEGFRRTARAAGLPAPRKLIVPDHGSADAAARAAARLGDADAVFCSTDVYAVGLLSALRARARRVPDEVAVIGLGDLEMGRHAVPPLTTVRIDGRAIGATAAELVLAPERGRVVDVGFELVLRESG
ncbi:MAG: substrate-binding domain-containing protein, partial [Rhodospirillaceae bacterium]|nr:substrate-binding domain-containing protein [Rhodospirillaceae bacterium]